MKKVIVIGCPGSGKTTFAKRLREKTGLPLFHLDAIWHRADGGHIEREDFDLRLTEILEKDRWIIDGNYGRTLKRRLLACDTVFLFDLPTSVCLEGALSRLGQKREDLPFTDTVLDPLFALEIEGFQKEKLPLIYDLLDSCGGDKTVVVFKSREDGDRFLKEAAATGGLLPSSDS